MTCQMMVSLGVYVLGAADLDERRRIETHLPCCRACRAELLRLSPMPGLLAAIPRELVTGVPPTATVRTHSPGRTTAATGSPRSAGRPGRIAAGLAAVLAAASIAAVAVAAPWRAGGAAQPGAGAAQPAAGRGHVVTLAAANRAAHVRATAALTPTSWGTRIALTIRGVPQNVRCSLVVRSRSGATEISGVWDAWRPGAVSVPASADWRLPDIASLQVRAGSRTLLTMLVRPVDGGRGAARRGMVR